MRPRFAILAAIFLFTSLASASRATARQFPTNDAAPEPLPVFEFHSGFWVNLHHTLYYEARSQRESHTTQPDGLMVGLTPAERLAWAKAVSYYAAHYADRDLLFSTEMILLKNQLGDFENCSDLAGTKRKSCDAGLPFGLTQALDDAAPVYRAHLWPQHDRANRAWIAGVSPLVRRKGLELAQRLAAVYQTRWQRSRIWVDVCAFANWAGAYTTLDPLRVTIASQDARNQGEAALEVLFYEASHGIAEPVADAIARQCRQRDKPIPRDLWHAVMFYTTGEVVHSAVAPPQEQGGIPGDPAFEIREGLYRRGWQGYFELLARFWQPYLEGKADFDDAIARMVSAI